MRMPGGRADVRIPAGRRWYHRAMTRYRLHELAHLTGVTPRTIRFYIAEGLLPRPEGNGPAAVYSADHRDRLRLIALLKDRYLTLQEIRRELAALEPSAVPERLRAEETASGASGPTRADAGAQRSTDAADPSLPHREHWVRVILADGVELHIRGDLSREPTSVDTLVQRARELLGGN